MGFPNPQQSGGLTSPVAIADGGTGATTAADARTALGLGTVAVENTPLALNKGGTGATTASGARTALELGTAATAATDDFAAASHAHAGTDITSGTVDDARLSANVTVQGNTFNAASKLVQLTAGNQYPALDGSLITNISAGFVPGKAVLLKTDGTWTAYSTLAAARDAMAASAGSMVRVGPGTYNENDLAKDGGIWEFADGAIVTWTGADTHAIWDDEDGAITFSVSGRGVFGISNGGSQFQPVLYVGNASTVYLEAKKLSGTSGAALVCFNGTITIDCDVVDTPVTQLSINGTNTLLNFRAQYMTSAAQNFAVGAGTTNAIVGRIVSSGDSCVYGSTSGSFNLVAGTITGTTANGASIVDMNAGTFYITADLIANLKNTFSGGTAIEIGSTGDKYVRAQKIISTNGAAVYNHGGGNLYLSAHTVTAGTVDQYYATMICSDGASTTTTYLDVRRVVQTGANRSAVTLGPPAASGGGTDANVFVVEGDTAFVAHSGATNSLDCPSDADPLLYINGVARMNKALDASIAVLSGEYVESDSNVL